MSKELVPSSHQIISIPRKTGRRGGGIALVHREEEQVNLQEEYHFPCVECADFRLQIGEKTVIVCVLYLYPGSSVLDFVNNLCTYMEVNINRPHEVIILGDFNIKMEMDIPEDTLDSFGLKNSVNFPTHAAGHTIDLVITDQTSDIISNIQQRHFISDHCFIEFDLNIRVNKLKFNTIKKRLWRKIDNTSFALDLSEAFNMFEDQCEFNDINLFCSKYNNKLESLADKHAPIKVLKVKDRDPTPWMTDKLGSEIRL